MYVSLTTRVTWPSLSTRVPWCTDSGCIWHDPCYNFWACSHSWWFLLINDELRIEYKSQSLKSLTSFCWWQHQLSSNSQLLSEKIFYFWTHTVSAESYMDLFLLQIKICTGTSWICVNLLTWPDWALRADHTPPALSVCLWVSDQTQLCLSVSLSSDAVTALSFCESLIRRRHTYFLSLTIFERAARTFSVPLTNLSLIFYPEIQSGFSPQYYFSIIWEENFILDEFNFMRMCQK